MQQTIIDLFQQFIFVYSVCMMCVYVFLAISSFINVDNYAKRNKSYNIRNIVSSPLAPGISVIAPAYNEGLSIVSNVEALLSLEYPKFEVIIINDGSTDDTMDKLIQNFDLVEVNYLYEERIKTKPVNRFLKSRNSAYDKLLIIDKENGKGKADASNAGINASSFDYFLCTDVDCILAQDTLLRLIRPFLGESSRIRKFIGRLSGKQLDYAQSPDRQKKVIAVGAPLRMINSAKVDSSVIVRFRPPVKLLPRFQELEYIRAYLLSKMGWNGINCVPNVSGGLGLFDKGVAIKVGGYDPRSFAEDIDMVTRMGLYMIQNNLRYAVRYIPVSLCWTEGPETLKVFGRQRIRWARGLVQIMLIHKNIIFNPRYGRLGLIVFPYNLVFEFLAPVLETLGMLFYVYLIAIGAINWHNTFILLGFLYSFSILMSTMAVLWDQYTQRQYFKTWEVVALCFTSLLEPVIYHPLVVFFSLRGYVKSLFKRELVWGDMQRKGFTDNQGDLSVTLN
jgi:cellulose synthase/poly-beta-1,6-N-acetylglucosamine synthase-like glycosyltransferase